MIDEHVSDDGSKLSANEIHSYLSRVMYKRRNKMNPLWNTLLVAGKSDLIFSVIFFYICIHIVPIICSNRFQGWRVVSRFS
jgi:hypothetical protein